MSKALVNKEFLNTPDASEIGFTSDEAGAVLTNVKNKLEEVVSAFDFMTSAQIADVQARTLLLDVTVPLQAFFDACKGKKGYIPAGSYKKTAQITLDPIFSYDISGAGWNSENYADQGTAIVDTTDANGLFIYYSLANFPGGPAGSGLGYPNSDNRVKLSGFKLVGPGTFTAPTNQTIGIEGVNTSTPKGNGIYAYWVQGLELSNVWISNYQGNGLYGYRCFSSYIKDCFFVKNGSCGIHFYKTANAVQLTGVKALVNCWARTSGPNAVNGLARNYNILLDGDNGYESLGSVIDGPCDVSYAGQFGPNYLSIANTKLTNIVVSGGTATVNATAHPYQVGDRIAILGSYSPNDGINTINEATVLTIGTNSFTVATTAANATYNGADLAICPYSGGIGVNNIQAIQIEAYCEDSPGPGIYIGPQVNGFTVRGGYWQDSRILIDTAAKGGTISGCYFNGGRSGVVMPNARSALLHNNRYALLAVRGTPTATLGGGLPTLEANSLSYGNMTLEGLTIGRGAETDNTAISNTAFGVGALNNNLTTSPTDGIFNTAVGYYALNANTVGYNNIAIGRNAGLTNTTGFANIWLGARSGDTGTNIQNCVNIGFATASGVTSGGSDVNIGNAAGSKAVAGASGSNNVNVGRDAGKTDSSQAHATCTIVGGQTGPLTVAALANYVGLGYDIHSFAASNKVRIGNASIATAHVQVAFTATSDQKFKKNVRDLDLGVSFLNTLRPVSYERTNGNETEELGLIAQEVEAVLPRPLGLLDRDVDGTYGLRKDDLIAVLIKAVQELSAEVETLKTKLP